MWMVLLNFLTRFGLAVYGLVIINEVPDGWQRLMFLIVVLMFLDHTFANTARMAKEQQEGK